jgi:phosphate transport system substrate-binding protein
VNITGIKPGALKLSGQVLGDIYLGRILKWNEPAIVALNPGLELPNMNITVVHRADASGTTFLWSEFLSRSNPEWKARVGAGTLLAWPAGVADVGNEGVASSVQRTRVSIGYVEYAYAKRHNLATVSVRNREGTFVMPGRSSFEAAAGAARWQRSADLDQALIDPPGAESWPITGASFILLPSHPDQASRSLAIMKFFDWALRHGQQMAADLDYVPMPDSAAALIGRAWAEQVRQADGRAIWHPGDSSRH